MMKTKIIPLTFLIFVLSSFMAKSYSLAGWIKHEAFGTGGAAGLAWGDYNNDGYEDLAIVGPAGFPFSGFRVLLQENSGPDVNGQVSFSKVQYLGSPMEFRPYGVVWADINNDGYLDLTIVGGNTGLSGVSVEPIYIYINQGAPNYFDDAQIIKLGEAGTESSRSAAWSDLNGDGFVDLIVANYEGPCRVYLNNGDLTFSAIPHVPPLLRLTPTNAQAVSCWNFTTHMTKFAFATENGVYLCNLTETTSGYGWTSSKVEGLENYNANSVSWYPSGGLVKLAVSGKPDSDTEDKGLKIVKFNRLTANIEGIDESSINKEVRGVQYIPSVYNNVYKGLVFYFEGRIRIIPNNATADCYLMDDEGHPYEAYGIALADFDNDGDVDAAANVDVRKPNILLENNDKAIFPRIHLIGLRHLNGEGWSNRNAIGAKIYKNDWDYCIGSIQAGSGCFSGNSIVFCPQFWGDYRFEFPSGHRISIENAPDLRILTDSLFYISESRDVYIYEDGRIEFNPGFIAYYPAKGTIARWGHYDDDGFPDLAVITQDDEYPYDNDSLKIYKNNWLTSRRFELLSPGYDLGTHVDYLHKWDLCWGDYNNDGLMDIAISGPRNFLLVNTGDQFELKGDLFGDHGGGLQWIDADADGYLDLVIINEGGDAIDLHHNEWLNNPGQFDKETIANSGGLPELFPPIISVIDFNLDMKTDILAPWGFLPNDRVGVNTMPSFGNVYVCDLNHFHHYASWFDYDLDHDPDLLTNRKKYVNEWKSGEFIPDFRGELPGYGDDWGVPGDWNLDGFEDIFTDHGLYVLDYDEASDSHNFYKYKLYHKLTGESIVLADMDRDGDLDFWSNGYIYENTCLDRGSILVTVEGLSYQNSSTSDEPCCNRDGLGVRVELYEAGTNKLVGNQEVGSGRQAVPGEVFFGTPTDKSYDIKIIFPSNKIIDKNSNPALSNINPNNFFGKPIHVQEDGSVLTPIVENGKRRNVPLKFTVFQNYPNPFNPTTKIDYVIPQASKVVIKIYNCLGQHVRTLLNERKSKGRHSVVWDGYDDYGNKVTSGLYFYRVYWNNKVETKKMLLIY